MPATVSIHQVKVDDSDFLRFKELFDQYRTEVKETPSAWDETNQSLKGIAGHFSKMAEALKTQADLMEKLNRAQDKESRSAEDTERAFDKTERHTAKIASNISNATVNLLKWAGITTAIGGLLGLGGSVFGLDRLAGMSSDQTRRAQGLGINPGEQNAFRINMGRYVDSDSFLSRIADAQADLGKRRPFFSTGISEDEIASKNPSQLGVEFLQRAHSMWNRSKDHSKIWAESNGLLDVLSYDELRRLGDTPQSKLAGSIQDYTKDQKDLFQGKDTQDRWQNFDIQIDRVTEKFENSLLPALEGLVTPLGNLSKKVGDTIDAFLKSDNLKRLMNDLGDGIERLTKYLGSDEMYSDLETLRQDFQYLSQAIKDLLQALGFLPPENSKSSIGEQRSEQDAQRGISSPEDVGKTPWQEHNDRVEKDLKEAAGGPIWRGNDSVNKDLEDQTKGTYADPKSWWHYLNNDNRVPINPIWNHILPTTKSSEMWKNEDISMNALKAMGFSGESAHGITRRLKDESGLDPKSDVIDSDGLPSGGIMQLHAPSRRAQYEKWYGHSVEKGTIEEQLQFIVREMQESQDKTMRNTLDALKNTNDEDYAYRLFKNNYERPKGSQVIVTINNQTGGSVINTTQQVAQ